MIDVDLLRKQPELFIDLIDKGRGNKQKANVKNWLELDKQRTRLIETVDSLRNRRNILNKDLKDKPGENVINEVRKLKEQIALKESELKGIEIQWQEILDWMPNLPVSDVDMPDGKDENDNISVKAWIPGQGYIDDKFLGKVTETAKYMPNKLMYTDEQFEPKHHLDLGENLGVIDNAQAAKVSGTRFTYISGDLALLQYAIQQLLFNELINRGFTYLIPPILVKDRALYGSSHFPEQSDQIYEIKNDYIEEGQNLYLVGSSEPSNFAFFMDKILNEEDLPIKIFAYTPCFRTEVGSWGKDVRGIKRLHQFDKVEMDVICKPEDSNRIFDELLGINEWLLQSLGLPYHLALKCKSDAGYLASAKQLDPEIWLCGQQTFMEMGTDTNTTDYQSRRLNIKYKTKDGKLKLVHTLNDTGVAMGRMLLAITDAYQQKDGSIKVPDALKPFIGKEFIKQI